MGANLITRSLDGALTRQQVVEEFRDWSRQAAYEDGASYSGSWNMLHGVDFARVPAFPDEQAAVDYISEHAQKWEAALAVRYRFKTLTRKPTFNGKDGRGVNGGKPVHSLDYTRDGIVVVPADQLGERDKAAVVKAVTRKQDADRDCRVAVEALRRTTQAIERLEVVTASVIKPQQAAVRRAKKAAEAAETALNDLAARLAPKLYVEADGGERWMVGGSAAS